MDILDFVFPTWIDFLTSLPRQDLAIIFASIFPMVMLLPNSFQEKFEKTGYEKLNRENVSKLSSQKKWLFIREMFGM